MPAEADKASGMGRSWQSTFSANTREAAQDRMTELDYTWEWQPNGDLRATTPVLPAVRDLGDGRASFFNQLIAAFNGWKDTRNDPAKAITFGDGSPLDPEDVAAASPGRRLHLRSPLASWRSGPRGQLHRHARPPHLHRHPQSPRQPRGSVRPFPLASNAGWRIFPANHDAFIPRFLLCLGGLLKAQSVSDSATPVRNTCACRFQCGVTVFGTQAQQGSWVAMCNDDKGRIIVSDQFGGLYRFTPPAPGKQLQQSDIEKVPAKIRAANGLLAKGALYVAVNDYERKFPSGLYRVTDSDGDDKLDKVVLLREMFARGDHGVHAICLDQVIHFTDHG